MCGDEYDDVQRNGGCCAQRERSGRAQEERFTARSCDLEEVSRGEDFRVDPDNRRIAHCSGLSPAS